MNIFSFHTILVDVYQDGNSLASIKESYVSVQYLLMFILIMSGSVSGDIYVSVQYLLMFIASILANGMITELSFRTILVDVYPNGDEASEEDLNGFRTILVDVYRLWEKKEDYLLAGFRTILVDVYLTLNGHIIYRRFCFRTILVDVYLRQCIKQCKHCQSFRTILVDVYPKSRKAYKDATKKFPYNTC